VTVAVTVTVTVKVTATVNDAEMLMHWTVTRFINNKINEDRFLRVVFCFALCSSLKAPLHNQSEDVYVSHHK
jgi:hypothetical protein